jgi:hypothetical protein
MMILLDFVKVKSFSRIPRHHAVRCHPLIVLQHVFLTFGGREVEYLSRCTEWAVIEPRLIVHERATRKSRVGIVHAIMSTPDKIFPSGIATMLQSTAALSPEHWIDPPGQRGKPSSLNDDRERKIIDWIRQKAEQEAPVAK